MLRRASRPTSASLAAATILTGLVVTLTAAGDQATPAAASATSTGPAQARQTAVPAQVVRRTRFRPAVTDTGAPAKVSKPPKLRARSWVVADLDTGRILATHAPHRRLPQASTIKLLTAVTAAQTVRPRPAHRVTRAEAHPQFCTCVGLKVGRRYTRTALMAGMLLPSGNDAAEALAGSHPRGRAAFVAAMNAKAAELGASDTHAVTPSGLTAAGAHSSARDLLVFLRAAQVDPVVEPLLNKSSFRFGPRGGAKHRIYRRTDYVNTYVDENPGTQGKSGYTTPARNTLVVSTPIDGHRIGVATLGAPGGYSTSGARALTMWANRNFDRLGALGRLPAEP